MAGGPLRRSKPQPAIKRELGAETASLPQHISKQTLAAGVSHQRRRLTRTPSRPAREAKSITLTAAFAALMPPTALGQMLTAFRLCRARCVAILEKKVFENERPIARV
jgi:hypothetical protein